MPNFVVAEEFKENQKKNNSPIDARHDDESKAEKARLEEIEKQKAEKFRLNAIHSETRRKAKDQLAEYRMTMINPDTGKYLTTDEAIQHLKQTEPALYQAWLDAEKHFNG